MIMCQFIVHIVMSSVL